MTTTLSSDEDLSDVERMDGDPRLQRHLTEPKILLSIPEGQPMRRRAQTCDSTIIKRLHWQVYIRWCSV